MVSNGQNPLLADVRPRRRRSLAILGSILPPKSISASHTVPVQMKVTLRAYLGSLASELAGPSLRLLGAENRSRESPAHEIEERSQQWAQGWDAADHDCDAADHDGDVALHVSPR